MKIAHIISSCQPAGAELLTKSLLIKLKKHKDIDEIELWVMMKVEELDAGNTKKIKYQKEFVEELREKNINVRFVEKKLKKDWLKTKKKIREFYHSFKPDIVHSHHESVTFHLCRALHKYDVKLIETIHSNAINYSYLHNLYIKHKLSTYIAISDRVSELINKKLGYKNFVIYNGIELDRFRENDRVFSKDIKSIISIGRLTEVKDHRTLIKAYSILKEKIIKYNYTLPQLLIVGDGELRNELEKLVIEEELQENVKFLGIRNDIPHLLKNSDLYVMSSQLEGLSISLIEALASGITIVATDVGSNDEIVQHNKNGLLVPKKNPMKLAEAIFKLIQNSELRKEFYLNALEYSKKFDIKVSAEDHVQVYHNVMIN